MWEWLKVDVKGTKIWKFVSSKQVFVPFMGDKMKVPTHSVTPNSKSSKFWHHICINYLVLKEFYFLLLVSNFGFGTSIILSHNNTRKAKPRPEPSNVNGRIRYWRPRTSRSLPESVFPSSRENRRSFGFRSSPN